ncbi:MAG TPA: hypothetical protein VHI98_21460 [Vicinamibacterales bacterium]|nr:hypothetical protein [Vicinamibacterales bacterium]
MVGEVMDVLFVVVLVAMALLSAAVPIAWGVYSAWAGSRAGQPNGGAVPRSQTELDELVAQLSRQLGAYSNLPINKRAGQRQQISSMLTQMNQRMRGMNSLGRERYGTRAGELSSMAAKAGIDWRAPSC